MTNRSARLPGGESPSLSDATLKTLAKRIAEEVARQVAPLLAQLSAPKMAYTVQKAAAATGVSPDVIRRAIRSGNLAASYPSNRPVIPAVELASWLESRIGVRRA